MTVTVNILFPDGSIYMEESSREFSDDALGAISLGIWLYEQRRIAQEKFPGYALDVTIS